MSLGVSRLGGMSQEQRDRLASSVRLLLLWVAASDGNVDESELQVAYQQFPEVEGSMTRDAPVSCSRLSGGTRARDPRRSRCGG